MSSKFFRGTSLLKGSATVPGHHLTEYEKEIYLKVLKGCRDWGYDFYPTVIQKVDYDEMSEIAAYGGFPKRWPHWKWGMEFEQLQRGYEHNNYRIYEMVINCLILDSNILTTNGKMKIGDICVGDKVLSRSGVRNVVGIRNNHSDVICIKLKEFDNNPVCTAKHKWLCYRDGDKRWVEAADLVVGDVLIGGGSYDNFLGVQSEINWQPDDVISETRPNIRSRLQPISPPDKMNLDVAELLGICVGDGSIGCRWASNLVSVCIHDKQVEYMNYVRSLFFNVFGREPKVKHKKSVYTVDFHSKFAVDFFDKIGYGKGCTHYHKRVPWSIFSSSNEYRSAFLRGLFDTDGYCGKYLSISCKNKDLAADIQLLLLEMGIRSKVDRVINKHNDISIVTIKGRSNVIKFRKYIGFNLKYKKDALDVLCDCGPQSYGGIYIPGIKEEIINRIRNSPDEFPEWAVNFTRRNKNEKIHSNALWAFVDRLIANGFEQFGDIFEILDNPLYEVESIEDAGTADVVDISLDHPSHDFLANGLISHNCNPCYIYVMTSNTLMDNVLVVAHATGHNDFFKNNVFFQPTIKNALNKFANHAERIRKYIDRWGLERVTEFIDNVLRIETLIDPYNAWADKKPREYIFKDKREYEFPRTIEVSTDRLHMHPWLNPKEWREKEKNRIKEKETALDLGIPQQQDKDIFCHIKDNAPLKPWQADIIAMLYEEAMYYAPQRATKVANEGWACVRNAKLSSKSGLIDIEVIVDNKIPIDVYDGEKVQKVTNWFKFEDRDIVKIRTKKGFVLEGSNNHRIWDGSGDWKQLSELLLGDKVKLLSTGCLFSEKYFEVNFSENKRLSVSDLCRERGISVKSFKVVKGGGVVRNQLKVQEVIDYYLEELDRCDGIYTQNVRRKAIKIPKNINEDFAQFLGYMIGDGHISVKKRTLGLTTGDLEQAEEYSRIVKDLFGLQVKQRWDDSSKNGRWRLSVSSTNLQELLVDLGLKTGKCARIKEVPECIFRSPKSVVSAFLRAYFDSDGYAGNAGVILSTASEKLGEQIQILLLNYGILSNRKLQKDGCWHVSIANETVKIFEKEIGFGLKRKQNKLKDFIKNHSFWKEVKWEDEIESIEHDKGTVYDITVEETHRYASHGFMNHNSMADFELLARQGMVSLGQKSHDCGIIEYGKHKWGVLGGKYSMNPYKLGFYLFLDIEERWNKGRFGPAYEECKNIREKEHWDLNLNLGKEKIFEVRKHYNDVTLIAEYFTQEFCDKYEFFEWKRFNNGEYRIESRDHKVIKEKLLQRYTNGGLPDIRLADPNHRNQNIFLLEHHWDGRILHDPYTRAVLASINYLMNQEVMLTTRDASGEEYIYICNGPDEDNDVIKVTRKEYEESW